MYLHHIKIERAHYDNVRSGRKTFEIRLNDRGYQANDVVVLTPLTNINTTDITLPKLEAIIGYVTPFQQKDGWVVFSLLNVKEQS
jgi:hypothetical protein